MARVIQDSDDEGDLGDPSPRRLTANAPPAIIEGLATSTSGSAPSMNGTSSSESKLLREMRNAHDDMFEPSPSTSGKRARGHDGAETVFATNGSSPSRLKRTKTTQATTFPSGLSLDPNLTAGEKSSGLKRSRTAGTTRSPTKMFESPPLGKKKKLQRTYSRKPAAYALEDGHLAEQLSDQAEEDLPVKDVAYKKVPATIVSDPLGQSQEIEIQQTVAPLDTLHHKPQPSPINSSAFLSPTSVSDHFTQPILNTQPGPSLHQDHMAEGFDGVNPNLLFPEMSSTIAASSSSIEKRLAGPLKVDLEQNLQIDHESPRSRDRSPIHDKPSHVEDNVFTASSSGKTGDIPDQSVTEKADNPIDKRQNKYKSIASSDAVLPPSDDLIGLPKEMYKPRPSRSRSARSTQANTPASGEAGAGRLNKPRRSRTADGTSANTIQMLVDMGFTASDSEAALIATGWVMDKTLDILTRARSKSQSPLLEKSHPAAVDDANKITQPSFLKGTGDHASTKDAEWNGEVAHDTPDIDKVEQVHDEGDAQGKPGVESPHVTDGVRDTDTAQTQGRSQDLVEFVAKSGGPDTGDSPSSNTKLKRTKSTKNRGRPRKSEDKVVEDEQLDVDELSAPPPATPATANPAAAEVRVQEASDTKPPEVVVKTDSKPSKRSRDDKEINRKLSSACVPDVEAEVIEIDDDSDGPPKATKLRRMMTAPASVLKKEKKKRGRPGKKTKTEATEAKHGEAGSTSLTKGDLGAPGPSQVSEEEKREVLKDLDKNAAPTDQATQESIKHTFEPEEAGKKTKKVKASSKNVDTSRETPQASVDAEEDSVEQAGAGPKEASKKSKKAKANSKSLDTARETPSRETPQASVNEEHDPVEKPSTPKTSDKGKSAIQTTAKTADETDTSKKATTEKKKGGHSPIKNVIRTVNYRVGLSKRTKIEPLLKIKRR